MCPVAPVSRVSFLSKVVCLAIDRERTRCSLLVDDEDRHAIVHPPTVRMFGTARGGRIRRSLIHTPHMPYRHLLRLLVRSHIAAELKLLLRSSQAHGRMRGGRTTG